MGGTSFQNDPKQGPFWVPSHPPKLTVFRKSRFLHSRPFAKKYMPKLNGFWTSFFKKRKKVLFALFVILAKKGGQKGVFLPQIRDFGPRGPPKSEIEVPKSGSTQIFDPPRFFGDPQIFWGRPDFWTPQIFWETPDFLGTPDFWTPQIFRGTPKIRPHPIFGPRLE